MFKKLILVIAFCGVLFLFIRPGSKVECWEHEINIASGHERYTRYLLWMPVKRTVSETWISEGLGAEPGPEEDWRKVVTLSHRARHSPHYKFHAALHQIRMFEPAVFHEGVHEEVCEKIAGNVLLLWQLTDDDAEAGEYLRDLAATGESGGRRPLTIQDIPDVPGWMRGRLVAKEGDGENEWYLERYRAWIAEAERFSGEGR